MSTFGERLKGARTDKGLKQRELAKIIGIKTPACISAWEHDTAMPELRTCVNLCKALDISLDYLLDCSDSAVQFTQNQKQLARAYGQLDAHGKRMIEAVVKVELERFRTEQKKSRSKKIVQMPKRRPGTYLPCADQAASAGTGIMLGPEEAMEQVLVEDNEKSRRADFLVAVSGDSMEPAFHHGDLLLVKKTEELSVGEFGLFSLNGDGYVKRLGNGQLESLNPAYDPIPLDETSDLRVFGRILGTARRPAGC